LSYHAADDAAAAPTPTRLGRYELLGHLATGGMAEIHLARLAGEAGFEKIVVVKRLLPELVASKAFVAMFLDEAKLVARLSHPNVCEVHELGRDGVEYFLVMPFLDGVPATDFIARPRDPDRIAQVRVAAGIVAQACAGLHHAHELAAADGSSLGLVHRDVSPSNVFVTSAGIVKVLDFGVAKVRGAAETEAGTIKGKTQYMAPEQLLGEPLDRRCDVFALGILLFELATHQRLFKRASDFLSAKAILEEPIQRAEAVDPAVPTALADVIARALERAPASRFADAREMGKAIEAALASHGGVAPPDAIAAALADWHGAELSAMRTRQAHVLGDARSRATDVATAVGSGVATKPRAIAARPRRRAIVVGGLAVAVLGIGALALGLATRTDTGTGLGGSPGTADGRGTAPSTIGGAAGAQTASGGERGAQLTTNDEHGAQMTTDGDRGAQPGSDAAANQADAVEPDRKSAASQHAAGAPTPRPGLISIDSTPFATIYVDGAKLGVTPLVKKPLHAGAHKLKAVLADGRSRTIEIDVRASKLGKPIVLTW
jgi:serine/threonine-protein kinase